MTTWKRLLAVALGLGTASTAVADDDIRPAGLFRRAVNAVCPPTAAPACPPTMPGSPLVFPPGTGTPGAPGTPGTTDPTAPPGVERPGQSGGSNLVAEAPARGTDAPSTFFPTINGDLLGGAGFAGPFAQRVNANGQPIGPTPTFILASGQVVRQSSPSTSFSPTDELLLARSRATSNQSSGQTSRVVATFPQDGTTFSPSDINQLARFPSVVRGAFKVTENESPRPTTRFYVSYYFYDQVYNSISSPDVPRTQLHQEIIGYEQAFLNNKASISVRLPYNQLISQGFFTDSSLGDLTFVGKVVVYENREVGDLISTGLVVTLPTGSRPFANTITGDTVRGSYIQPFVGYIITNGDFYLQGLSSLAVPTDTTDAMILSNSAQLGYYLYRNPGGALSAIIPTAEMHLNTPLTHRFSNTNPIAFPDSLTALAGTQFVYRNKSSLGVVVGSPLTGPRPFSLQLTAQLNVWF